MTTKQDIERWIYNAPKNATHMIVVCDHFSYEDYPVYVKKNEDVSEIEAKYSGENMQSIMEIYNLNMDIQKQLSAGRVFNH